MKFAIATAVAAAALAGPALAGTPEVEVRNAVARVVVIVEDRADVGVEIEQGSSALPALELRRRGDQVRIDGGLGRGRVAGLRTPASRARGPRSRSAVWAGSMSRTPR